VDQPLRVVHYINTVFAGDGSEAVASAPVQVRGDFAGPSRALAAALGDAARIVGTIVAGDDDVSDQRETAREAVRAALRDLAPDVVVAGPAFDAGRYGIACAEVCRVADEEGIPAVTAMHPAAPGTARFRREVLIVPTSSDPAEMAEAVRALARLALKLARHEDLGPAEVDGYVPRGFRRPGLRDEPGWKRALDMLEAKLAGHAFVSEVPYQAHERVPPAPPVRDLGDVTIALVTTGGLVPLGNPDTQTSENAKVYHRYPIGPLETLRSGEWEACHVGYFTHLVDRNPNYVLPLGAVRQMESAGVIGAIHPYVYTLPGVSTPVARAQWLGDAIAAQLREGQVGGCLLVSTSGTCTRCGATIAKEIERVGIPVAMISAIHDLALATGANRVVQGCRIEHVCGNPDLGSEKDREYGLRIVRAALHALATPVSGPTLFDPADPALAEVVHAS
jgi:glycine reductase